MEQKERYVSSEEKQTLRKDNKWAAFGKSLLKGAVLIAGGLTVATASAVVGFPTGVYITAGAMYMIGRKVFTETAVNFVNLFTKENNNTKEM